MTIVKEDVGTDLAILERKISQSMFQFTRSKFQVDIKQRASDLNASEMGPIMTHAQLNVKPGPAKKINKQPVISPKYFATIQAVQTRRKKNHSAVVCEREQEDAQRSYHSPLSGRNISVIDSRRMFDKSAQTYSALVTHSPFLFMDQTATDDRTRKSKTLRGALFMTTTTFRPAAKI